MGCPEFVIQLDNLTPGDLSLICRKSEAFGECDPARLGKWLEKEAAKPGGATEDRILIRRANVFPVFISSKTLEADTMIEDLHSGILPNEPDVYEEESASPNRQASLIGDLRSKTISELVGWRQNEKGSRLLLPPIQRSIVWSNEQVINYWDSLLRGYPAGMMTVHRVNANNSAPAALGRDVNGMTRPANDDDFLLFDGQQRMAAVLLGFGVGQMKNNRKLWVDFGVEPNRSSGLKFQLRITSTGQPFGYRPDAANQKLELSLRREKWVKWKEKHNDKTTPQYVFEHAGGVDIIQAKSAVSFSEICDTLSALGRDATIDNVAKRVGTSRILDEFVTALERALGSKIVLQEVAREIVSDPEEYVRFFERLGQGGTRLSDDELTYSIIKHSYPKIHDRMSEIMRGEAGRLASEVDMVLSALRVAKIMAPWDGAKESELISRPSPAFVSQLKNKTSVQSRFLQMIPPESHKSPLETALSGLRNGLSYDPTMHSSGLPGMLLACLPRELIDVLLLFSVKRVKDQPWTEVDRDTLCAFVLHWLLFVADDSGAAWCTFQLAKDEKWSFSKHSVCSLLETFEKDGIARFLPRRTDLSKLRDQVNEGSHRLRHWVERFTAADADHEVGKPGDALRVLSTDRARIKRSLMWLQRCYIECNFQNYDPTSDRDDDLPIDLDHIIPGGIFDFDWRYREARLEKKAITEEFRWQRRTVGNSLGNFRWLDASENRSKGMGPNDGFLKGGEGFTRSEDLVSNPWEWNSIIPLEGQTQYWSQNNIATFQRIIDLRTLDLFENLLTQGGIETILPVHLPNQ
jgi:Protein of unknown function DUF262